MVMKAAPKPPACAILAMNSRRVIVIPLLSFASPVGSYADSPLDPENQSLMPTDSSSGTGAFFGIGKGIT
jgi:hypothetical protein